MRTEHRWRKRRRGYGYLVTGLALLCIFLIVAALFPRGWHWVFGVAGFTSFILCTSKALALWNVDGVVFEQRVPPRIDRSSILDRGLMSDANATPGRRDSRVLNWQLKGSFSPGRDGGR